MFRIKPRHLLVSIFLVFLTVPALRPIGAEAQSFRYMDEAGNIYWAESIDHIPPRYRSQVVAQPTPITDRKLLKKKQKEAEKAKKKKKKEKKKKEHKDNIPRPKKEKVEKEERVEKPAKEEEPYVEGVTKRQIKRKQREQDQLAEIPPMK